MGKKKKKRRKGKKTKKTKKQKKGTKNTMAWMESMVIRVKDIWKKKTQRVDSKKPKD